MCVCVCARVRLCVFWQNVVLSQGRITVEGAGVHAVVIQTTKKNQVLTKRKTDREKQKVFLAQSTEMI